MHDADDGVWPSLPLADRYHSLIATVTEAQQKMIITPFCKISNFGWIWTWLDSTLCPRKK